MIATETTLDMRTRENGGLTLLCHDILEETTQLLPNWLSSRVRNLIGEMTFRGGSAQEMQEFWNKSQEIRLYKLYDKVSNLLNGSWMDDEKRKTYSNYTKRLCQDVDQNHGTLNITKIAKTVL